MWWWAFSLIFLKLRFIIDSSLSFQNYSGFSVRGMFYELLKHEDPELAKSIHAGGALAPFSLSPLIITKGNSSKIAWKEAISPSIGMITLSLLDDKLVKAFESLILRGELKEITLSNNKLTLTEIGVQEINFKKILDSSQPVRSFRIEFRTPTYFRRSLYNCCSYCPLYQSILKAKMAKIEVRACPYYKLERRYRFILFPDPILLFRSLLRIWRKYSDIQMDYKGFMDWIEKGGVALAGYPKGLKTLKVVEHPLTKKWVVGFIGTVYFDLPLETYDQNYAKLCDALLRFGEIVNVGGGRTAGLGLIHYESIELIIPPQTSSNQGG
ncbi:MAG: CRISPR system precrRNA processing endoribonuclease RAMP protein Cas6 [Nitrososphaerales archaeon]